MRERKLPEDYELWNDAPTMKTCPLWVYMVLAAFTMTVAEFACFLDGR